MIEEQYVSFDTAKMLKEAGFDCNCRKWYEQKEDEITEWEADASCNWNVNKNDFSRPTQALAARWLREVHKIVVDATFIPPSTDGNNWQYFVGKMNDMVWQGDYEPSNCKYSTYEGALEAALQEAVKLIKK